MQIFMSFQASLTCNIRRHGNTVRVQKGPESPILEVHLTEAEMDAILGNGVTSLARLAFAVAPPGTTPTDDQIRTLFAGAADPNLGTLAL